MPNYAMRQKIKNGEAVDLSTLPIERQGPIALVDMTNAGRSPYDIQSGEVDFCILTTEEWIWSIGHNPKTGRIVASTDARFYGMDGWECLWLR